MLHEKPTRTRTGPHAPRDRTPRFTRAGWYVLAAAFVIMFLNAGARYVIGVMPIGVEFGWAEAHTRLSSTWPGVCGRGDSRPPTTGTRPGGSSQGRSPFCGKGGYALYGHDDLPGSSCFGRWNAAGMGGVSIPFSARLLAAVRGAGEDWSA